MRRPRIRGEGKSFYHCTSRIIERRKLLGNREREKFVDIMRKLEAFLGVRVIAYCVMSNHFHLLVEEPDPKDLPPLDRESLLRKLAGLYDSHYVKSVSQELARAAQAGDLRWEEEILGRYRSRMGDVSVFLKELKQRFTQWFNRRTNRKGTLWEERFHSVLIEGDAGALMTVAAYIDLNPLRAGVAANVEDYRWSGYAAAVGGNLRAREGIGRVLEHSPLLAEGCSVTADWNQTGPVYRLWLFEQGRAREVTDAPSKVPIRGFSPEEIEEERARGGKLTLPKVLRHRFVNLSDGLILGSEAFVEKVLEVHRPWAKARWETQRGSEYTGPSQLCLFRARHACDSAAIARGAPERSEP